MKNIIITGATSGLGFKLLQKAQSENSYVIAIGRSLDQFRQSPEFSSLNHSLIHWIEIDLAQPLSKETRRLILQTLHQLKSKELSSIDCVFHNAGYLLGGPLEDLSSQQLSEQFYVNTLNIHELTRLLYPYLSSGSKIYAMGSVAGHFNYPFMGPYCASKHALRSLFESWYYEAKLRNIQFCHLSLGPIKTPFWDKSRTNNPNQNELYQKSLNEFHHLSFIIESRGLSVDIVVDKIWQSTSRKQLPMDWVIVKNKFFDFYLLKLVPQFIIKWFTLTKLKLNSEIL